MLNIIDSLATSYPAEMVFPSPDLKLECTTIACLKIPQSTRALLKYLALSTSFMTAHSHISHALLGAQQVPQVRDIDPDWSKVALSNCNACSRKCCGFSTQH